MMEIQCLITGKVQGVGFRNYVETAAAELGLFGYIKNNPDGSVLVLAQGEPDNLRLLVEYLHEGSLLSKVEGVSVEWGTAKETFDDFLLLQ
jgi:acylphosphatase